MSTSIATPGDGTGQPRNVGNGIGPAVYYGSIAVALALIIAITILSRIVYRRRQQKFQRTRLQEEREAQNRRGEAAGLPTYHESRTNNTGLPHYTVSYQPPPNLPPSSPPPAASPTQENHFHFHFPSLPAALHLRPRRPQDPEMGIPMTSNEPPKYEHSYLDHSPDSVPVLEAQHDEAVQQAQYEAPFIHPEELRRNGGLSPREEVENPIEMTERTDGARADEATSPSTETAPHLPEGMAYPPPSTARPSA